MKINGKKVLVTGVTGTLGERVAKRLNKEGADVRALIRDKKSATRLMELGITPVVGELINIDSLENAIKNVDIIIHCAAYLGEDSEEANRSNVIGVENIASISMKAGVKKFIHISTTSVYGEPTEGYLDENTPIAECHEEVYIQTKAQSERILNKYEEMGLDVAILRPGAICAEENSYWGDRQITRMLETSVVNWVHPDDIIAWVHADNLVEMIRLVIEKGGSGQIYNAIDGNFPEEKFRVRLIKVLGKQLQLPNRQIERPIYANTKIIELGYKPVRTFEETMTNLERIAVRQL